MSDQPTLYRYATAGEILDGMYRELPVVAAKPNYEAAADQLGLIDWIAIQNTHPSSVEMPSYEWLKAEARSVVDAALGEPA